MKAEVCIKQEVDIKKVSIDISPRYIGDGEDDDLPSDFPLLNEHKTCWRAMVDIDTGKIEGWPQGDAREMYVKVCDSGIYELIDVNNDVISHIEGYVPHGIVPGSYGDYVELKINEDGFITNWPRNKDISQFFEDWY